MSMKKSIEITLRHEFTRRKHLMFADTLYLTWLPKEDNTAQAMVNKIHRLYAKGFKVVPHIPAKKIKSKKELIDFLSRIKPFCKSVLLIGGSGKQEGEFATVEDLINTGAFGCDFNIGVAGFPEGNLSLSYEQTLTILKEKAKYANFVVTQWSYDVNAIKRFLDDSPLPVHIGVPAPCGWRQLIKFSKACGVKSVYKAFLSHYKSLFRLLWGFSPQYIINAVKGHKNLAGIHVFTFGKNKINLSA